MDSILIGKLAYYERWAVAFANLLFAKQVITPDELARKMQEVARRCGAPSGPTAPGS